MYQTINRCDFHDAFRTMDRLENFSIKGRDALFDYLEEYEESCGEKIELDVIALCCEYNQDKIEDVLKNYNLESLDELRDHTCVVWNDDESVLYQVY